jgi:tetratricopeptide (TPR) repeat protein
LGVLLARYGQLQNARQVLRHATKISNEPETWYNLAKVYELEGAPQQAAQALEKYDQLRVVAQQSGRERPEQVVNWVSPEYFGNSADPAGLGLHERSVSKLDENVDSGASNSAAAIRQIRGGPTRNGLLQSWGRLFQAKREAAAAAD